MSELIVNILDYDVTTSRCSSWILPIRPFPPRNLDPTYLKCHVCPGTSLRTSRPLCALLPSFGQWIRASPRERPSIPALEDRQVLCNFKLQSPLTPWQVSTTRPLVCNCVARPQLGTCVFRPSIAPIAWMTLKTCLKRIMRDPLGRENIMWTTRQRRVTYCLRLRIFQMTRPRNKAWFAQLFL